MDLRRGLKGKDKDYNRSVHVFIVTQKGRYVILLLIKKIAYKS